MATTSRLIPANDLLVGWTESELRAHIDELRLEPIGGCDACRFADPFSDRLCTIPDISTEDFDLGVSGIDCSRFQPRLRRGAEAAPKGPEEAEALLGPIP